MVKIQVNSSGKAYYTSGGKVLVATSGGITPTGSINITENGSHNVTAYATAVVNVTPDTTALEAQLDSIIAQGYYTGIHDEHSDPGQF